MHKNSVTIAITGASGSAYGLRLIQRLAQAEVYQHVLVSDAARVVFKQELDLTVADDAVDLVETLAEHLSISADYLTSYSQKDWFSPVASGSSGIRQMVIVPCSMGTLGRIAGGLSDNLLERAADVMLKEKRQLIIVPRETPLSEIHLENMLKLSRMGATIIPAMPGFYHRPKSVADLIDFMVDRVMDHLSIDDGSIHRWAE